MELQKGELIRPVVGLEDYYVVSNHGRVFRIEREVKRGIQKYIAKEKELSQAVNSVGYYVLNLKVNGVCFYRLVHRLIAEAFLSNTEGKDLVNHIDSNKLNNHVSNLEWVNRRENYSHWAAGQNHLSKYTGVNYNTLLKKWVAAARIDDELQRIGLFDTEKEAAQAYFSKLKELGVSNKYAVVV